MFSVTPVSEEQESKLVRTSGETHKFWSPFDPTFASAGQVEMFSRR